MWFRNLVTVVISIGLGVGLALAVVRPTSRSGPRPGPAQAARKSPEAVAKQLQPCRTLTLHHLKGHVPIAIYEPGYNPATLQSLEVPIQEIFAAEPRTESWAATVEKKIGQRMVADTSRLVPSVSKVAFDCKSTLCRLDFDFTSGEDLRAVKDLIYLFRAAPMTSYVVDHEAKRASLYLFYLFNGTESAESLDPGDFDRRRSHAIQLLRDGKVPLPAHFSRAGVESL
jgi:hypothetical protein